MTPQEKQHPRVAKPSAFGKRVRETRHARGMTQTRLATQLGMANESLCEIESGASPYPATQRIRAMADLLDVSADYLVGKTTMQGIERLLYGLMVLKPHAMGLVMDANALLVTMAPDTTLPDVAIAVLRLAGWNYVSTCQAWIYE